MHGFEDRSIRSDIGARRHAKAPHQAGELIGQDVAEQIGGDDDVELPGIHHELHRAGVDDAIVHLDPALVFLRDLVADFEKHAGQRLQDIGLVHDGDLLAPILERIVEREYRMIFAIPRGC